MFKRLFLPFLKVLAQGFIYIVIISLLYNHVTLKVGCLWRHVLLASGGVKKKKLNTTTSLLSAIKGTLTIDLGGIVLKEEIVFQR